MASPTNDDFVRYPGKWDLFVRKLTYDDLKLLCIAAQRYYCELNELPPYKDVPYPVKGEENENE